MEIANRVCFGDLKRSAISFIAQRSVDEFELVNEKLMTSKDWTSNLSKSEAEKHLFQESPGQYRYYSLFTLFLTTMHRIHLGSISKDSN